MATAPYDGPARLRTEPPRFSAACAVPPFRTQPELLPRLKFGTQGERRPPAMNDNFHRDDDLARAHARRRIPVDELAASSGLDKRLVKAIASGNFFQIRLSAGGSQSRSVSRRDDVS